MNRRAAAGERWIANVYTSNHDELAVSHRAVGEGPYDHDSPFVADPVEYLGERPAQFAWIVRDISTDVCVIRSSLRTMGTKRYVTNKNVRSCGSCWRPQYEQL